MKFLKLAFIALAINFSVNCMDTTFEPKSLRELCSNKVKDQIYNGSVRDCKEMVKNLINPSFTSADIFEDILQQDELFRNLHAIYDEMPMEKIYQMIILNKRLEKIRKDPHNGHFDMIKLLRDPFWNNIYESLNSEQRQVIDKNFQALEHFYLKNYYQAFKKINLSMQKKVITSLNYKKHLAKKYELAYALIGTYSSITIGIINGFMLKHAGIIDYNISLITSAPPTVHNIAVIMTMYATLTTFILMAVILRDIL